jgi:hypothetical protein
MQIEHAATQLAKPGDKVGIHVEEHAREHDNVFRIVPG